METMETMGMTVTLRTLMMLMVNLLPTLMMRMVNLLLMLKVMTTVLGKSENTEDKQIWLCTCVCCHFHACKNKNAIACAHQIEPK